LYTDADACTQAPCEKDAMMARRCPHCDQRLLPDEQRCWHCGRSVDPVRDEAAVGDSAPSEPIRNDASVAIYGGVTLVVVLVAIILTLFLGRQPRFEASTANLPQGWIVARDAEQTFAVFLPQSWQRYQSSSDESRLPEALVSSDLYRDALLPLAGFVDDEVAIFIAIGSEPSTFLLVARSSVLNRLSPTDVAGADYSESTEDGVSVFEARRLESLGTLQAHLQVRHRADTGDGGVCRQRFMRSEQAALLFSLCSMPGALGHDAAETILSSIQVLQD
jgi:hypothetical protein